MRVLLLIFIFSLTGCELFQSKELQCLKSTRLEFKDPDSLTVVQNLGHRGQVDNVGQKFFWLRYKAKNSYGAFTSSNMACTYENGAWVRDTAREVSSLRPMQIIYMGEVAEKLEAHNKKFAICKSQACQDERRDAVAQLPGQGVAERGIAEAVEKANYRVYQSLDPLVAQ